MRRDACGLELRPTTKWDIFIWPGWRRAPRIDSSSTGTVACAVFGVARQIAVEYPASNPAQARVPVLLRAMDSGSERLPDAPVSGRLLQHALGMELQADYKVFFRVVVTLDQSVFCESHRLEA